MDAFQIAALLLTSMAAGGINAVAGGGTLLTFPTLIWIGVPSLVANATSTVGLVPGALSGAWGYRREVRESSKWLAWLLPASFLGGIGGGVLLVGTPPAFFDRIVPFLVLGATMLFMVQDPISKWVQRNATQAGIPHQWIAAGAQFVIAIYGGYFGAGMGILLLSALSLLHLGSIHRMNGLKSLTGAAVNGVASAVFIAKGLVLWKIALLMAGGSILGGYVAADAARKLGQKTIRRIVITVGLVATASLAARRFL
jgi:hypothetical protein